MGEDADRRREIERLDAPRGRGPDDEPRLASRPPRLAPGYREGTILVRRAARMHRADDGAWSVVFDNDDPDARDTVELTLLPCRLMESMTRAATARGPETPMTVSGRVYVHDRRGYLLPTFVQYDQSDEIQPRQMSPCKKPRREAALEEVPPGSRPGGTLGALNRAVLERDRVRRRRPHRDPLDGREPGPVQRDPPVHHRRPDRAPKACAARSRSQGASPVGRQQRERPGPPMCTISETTTIISSAAGISAFHPSIITWSYRTRGTVQRMNIASTTSSIVLSRNTPIFRKTGIRPVDAVIVAPTSGRS